MSTVKFSMNMNKELKKKLQHIAIDEETNMTEIIIQILEEYVNNYYGEKEINIYDINNILLNGLVYHYFLNNTYSIV